MKTDFFRFQTLTDSLLFIAFPFQHRAVPMEKLALLPLVTIATNTGLQTIGCYATTSVGYHARNSTAMVIVSMETFDHGC
jgi:hypothetical protein